MQTVTFRIRPTPASDFQDLRRTLVLVGGVHSAEIQPDRIGVTFDPGRTDLARVRALIEHKGFMTAEGPPERTEHGVDAGEHAEQL